MPRESMTFLGGAGGKGGDAYSPNGNAIAGHGGQGGGVSHMPLGQQSSVRYDWGSFALSVFAPLLTFIFNGAPLLAYIFDVMS